MKMPEHLVGVVDPVAWERCIPYFDRQIDTDIEAYLVEKKAVEQRENLEAQQ